MSVSPFSIRRFSIAFAIGWLILMVDHALLLHWFDLPLKEAIWDSLLSNISLLAVCLLLMNSIRYYLPGRDQYVNIIVMCLMFTGIWLTIDRILLNSFVYDHLIAEDFISKSLVIRFSIGFLVVGITTMIAINWHSIQEQQAAESRKLDTERLARDAELYKLRQQLQPHFLFNSLNSINALIGTRPAEARKMVQQLSDFLRGTLKKEENQWISLNDELQHLQLYLDIEKVRFGHRLNTAVNSSDSTGKLQLPSMLLQPLVENAIKFGLYDTTEPVTITIAAAQENNYLAVTIQNPFDPETSSPKQGTGFGLSSVQRRLYLLFGRTDLVITNAKENIFTTEVKVPQLQNN